MKNNTFEDFLNEQCPPELLGGGADGAHEGYERWVENLDAEEVMTFAQIYGNKCYRKGKIDGMDTCLEKMKIPVEALKESLMKYCNPKPEYSGMMAGDLAARIMPSKENLKNLLS